MINLMLDGEGNVSAELCARSEPSESLEPLSASCRPLAWDELSAAPPPSARSPIHTVSSPVRGVVG